MDIKIEHFDELAEVLDIPFDMVVDLATSIGPDFKTDDGLETATYISLFTDRRFKFEDGETPIDGQRAGWWADALNEDSDLIGSRLWTLKRSKVTDETVALAREYSIEALQWMIDDLVAIAVNVESDRIDQETISIGIEIVRDKEKPQRYFFIWEAMR